MIVGNGNVVTSRRPKGKSNTFVVGHGNILFRARALEPENRIDGVAREVVLKAAVVEADFAATPAVHDERIRESARKEIAAIKRQRLSVFAHEARPARCCPASVSQERAVLKVVDAIPARAIAGVARPARQDRAVNAVRGLAGVECRVVRYACGQAKEQVCEPIALAGHGVDARLCPLALNIFLSCFFYFLTI